MTVLQQIDRYISGRVQPKRDEMQGLHRRILEIAPGAQLWFLDGKNAEGKVVSNPNIGYGRQSRTYADGETREFYRIGLSGNTSGISVYVMGLDDKTFLSQTYGQKLGKAKITGYCIHFRRLSDINLDILEDVIATHMREGAPQGA